MFSYLHYKHCDLIFVASEGLMLWQKKRTYDSLVPVDPAHSPLFLTTSSIITKEKQKLIYDLTNY